MGVGREKQTRYGCARSEARTLPARAERRSHFGRKDLRPWLRAWSVHRGDEASSPGSSAERRLGDDVRVARHAAAAAWRRVQGTPDNGACLCKTFRPDSWAQAVVAFHRN